MFGTEKAEVGINLVGVEKSQRSSYFMTSKQAKVKHLGKAMGGPI